MDILYKCERRLSNKLPYKVYQVDEAGRRHIISFLRHTDLICWLRECVFRTCHDNRCLTFSFDRVDYRYDPGVSGIMLTEFVRSVERGFTRAIMRIAQS